MLYGAVYGTNRPLAVLACVQGLLLLGFGLWLVPRALDSRTMALLWPGPVPDAALAGRMQQLQQTRADAVDSAAAELRRAERDLHDGAQAPLAAVGTGPPPAARLVPSPPPAAPPLGGQAPPTPAKAAAPPPDLRHG